MQGMTTHGMVLPSSHQTNCLGPSLSVGGKLWIESCNQPCPCQSVQAKAQGSCETPGSPRSATHMIRTEQSVSPLIPQQICTQTTVVFKCQSTYLSQRSLSDLHIESTSFRSGSICNNESTTMQLNTSSQAHHIVLRFTIH
jgi:hypothetical protein